MGCESVRSVAGAATVVPGRTGAVGNDGCAPASEKPVT